MSYNFSSNQTSDASQVAVQLDLIRRGWIYNIPSSRDARYDLVVDRGQDAPFRFETIQIKTIDSNKIRCTTRPHCKEFVSAHGKPRNNYHYRDLGIDWMVGVDKNGVCFYYPKSVFSQYETINIRVIPSVEFGYFSVQSSQPKIYDFDADIVSLI
jgi:hypothetical protein